MKTKSGDQSGCCRGRHFLRILIVAACFFLGCRDRDCFVLKDELKPTDLDELLQMGPDELERVDIARMNLICANAFRNGGSAFLDSQLQKLDEWTAKVKAAERKYVPGYRRNPSRYDNSPAKFRMVNLVLTLKEDLGCRYKRSLVDSGEMDNINSPAFFRNPDDVFITGLLGKRRGTCSSYAPLIAAIARRMGYPVHLKATRGHLFCCWTGNGESFNIDTNGDGADTPSDRQYLSDPRHGVSGMPESMLESERLMRPLNAADTLSFFLEIAGFCHEANGRMSEALRFYKSALRLRPGSKNLSRLASRRLPEECEGGRR